MRNYSSSHRTNTNMVFMMFGAWIQKIQKTSFNGFGTIRQGKRMKLWFVELLVVESQICCCKTMFPSFIVFPARNLLPLCTKPSGTRAIATESSTSFVLRSTSTLSNHGLRPLCSRWASTLPLLTSSPSLLLNRRRWRVKMTLRYELPLCRL